MCTPMPTTTRPWFHPTWANKDANGRDLGYPGPDGKTLYFRGFPVGSPTDWERIQRENKIGRWRER